MSDLATIIPVGKEVLLIRLFGHKIFQEQKYWVRSPGS